VRNTADQNGKEKDLARRENSLTEQQKPAERKITQAKNAHQRNKNSKQLKM